MMDSEQQYPQRHQLDYRGAGIDIAFIMLKNICLTVLTLGVYGAWGRTNLRRYVWNQTFFMGDRATYTGLGLELFKGWLKLLAVLVVVFLAVFTIQKLSPFPQVITSLASTILYSYIFALATYGGLRYRLSRTTWRKIHFGLDKNHSLTKEYLLLFFKGIGLSVVTIGFYYPFHKHHTRKFLTDRSRFGNKYFSYDGDAWELFYIYLFGVGFMILTLGIYSPWLVRDLTKYRFEHTVFDGGSRFRFNLRGGDLWLYGVISYIGMIVTLGLATPWIYNAGLSLFIKNTELVGEFDLNTVQEMTPTGDNAFDDIAAAHYDIDLGF